MTKEHDCLEEIFGPEDERWGLLLFKRHPWRYAAVTFRDLNSLSEESRAPYLDKLVYCFQLEEDSLDNSDPS